MTISEDTSASPPGIVLVAIDKDRNSQYAVKWACDHLMSKSNSLYLVHVLKTRSDGTSHTQDHDPVQIFIPYRGYCARKMVKAKEVILEESDVAKALVEYVNENLVGNLVLGATTRNALMKTFKKLDVPSSLLKTAPDFCSVYVISKSKVVNVRSAQRSVASTAAPPRQPNHSAERISTDSARSSSVRSMVSFFASERPSVERSFESVKESPRQWPQLGSPWKNIINPSMESIDFSGPLSGHNSVSGDDFSDISSRNSLVMSNNGLELSYSSNSSRGDSNAPLAPNSMEAEMRRLRLELQQTMDMYNSACKDANVAKDKAKVLSEWKSEHEGASFSEEQFVLEQAKARAAVEGAESAKKFAEQEVRSRQLAESKARQESKKTDQALTTLAKHDSRYRKYTIGEIEVATENFSPELKVGEGGYGPVYSGILDHTPVAIKILRPDAAQGRKQFNQEVEVLSSMRHPNMVLLLGACPEYGCLVYEYMNNGSLEDRLLCKDGTPPISWRTRFKIAAEIATALTFLHQAKPEPVVHRDLKPGNILLDRNYVSKISDVGLARLVPANVAESVTQYHMTSAAGTFCYIDPEYQQSGMLGTKSDVYSLGVMYLQIITAKPPMGLTHQVQRAIDNGTFAKILDPSVTDWPIEEALAFAELSLKCCELRKKDRPDLATAILPELTRLSELGMETDPDYFYYDNSAPQSVANSSASGSRPRLPQGFPSPWALSETSFDESTDGFSSRC